MPRIQLAIRISSRAPQKDARRRSAWALFAQEAEVWEYRIVNVVRLHFRSLREEVMRKLREHGPSLEGRLAGWSRRKVSEHFARKAPGDRINIDRQAAAKNLRDLVGPIVTAMVQDKGGEAMIRFGSMLQFNVNDPRARRFIGDRMDRFSREVAGTTFDRINAVVRGGFEEGKPLVVIADELRDTFEGFESYRAPLIARTETIAALNKADLLAIGQAGISDRLRKSWLTAGDEAVRDTHREAGERYADDPIPLDENFEVGDDSMEAPGLGDLPEENINCRCTVEYVPAEEP
jgi:hypothetical protein